MNGINSPSPKPAPPGIHILNGYYALVIDEHRRDFAPTLWDVHCPALSNAGS